MHAYFTGTRQHNGHLPAHHLDFRATGGYVLAPPSTVGGKPYRILWEPGGRGGLNWDTVTRLLQPQRQHQQPRRQAQASTLISATWRAGSPPSPKATATPACTGPPTAPWKPTPPPTSARWPTPPASAGLGDQEISRTLDSARRTAHPEPRLRARSR